MLRFSCHLVSITIFVSSLAGCASTRPIKSVEEGKGPIKRIEKHVRPEAINKQNRDVLDRVKELNQIYSAAYRNFEVESKNTPDVNPEKFYGGIIAQQKSFVPLAKKLAELANEQNRGIHAQGIENMRLLVLELSRQMRAYQDSMNKVLARQIEDVTETRKELENLHRIVSGAAGPP